MARLSGFVGSALKQPHLNHHIQPKAANGFFKSLISSEIDSPEESLISTDVQMTSGNLSPAQEDYFLALFWQSYHCTIPIIDEREFREHYASLRATTPSGGVYRKASPLVDIVLALCMQYGVAFIPRSGGSQISKTDTDSNDSSIAGREFYRRCQRLISRELENPSILLIRCHIFSALYLRNASFVNTAHDTLAVAIRTAYILGLHEEPPDDLSLPQKELRRRLWWMVYSLETKACIALGRPWQAHMSFVNCSLPADDQILAKQSGSSFVTYSEEATWLSYHLQCVTLVQAARAVHLAFYDKCSDVLETNEGKSFYSDPQSLEIIARFLPQSLQYIRTWARNVPDMLKTARKGDGEPFSTDRSALEIDPFAPLWLQRQRLLLELLYHNLVMILYRPFICFSPVSSSGTPQADGHAISCLNHAIAITNITNQTLEETDILNGWHEAYQFQWDAAVSMIGFCFAYPVCPFTPSARRVINSAISVFDTFGKNFAVASSAANVTRDLAAKADYLIDRFRTTFAPSSQLQSVTSASSLSTLQDFYHANGIDLNNPDIPDIPDILDIPDPSEISDLPEIPVNPINLVNPIDPINPINPIDPIDLTNPINPITMAPDEYKGSEAIAQNLLGLGFPIDSVGNLEPFWLSGNEIGFQI